MRKFNFNETNTNLERKHSTIFEIENFEENKVSPMVHDAQNSVNISPIIQVKERTEDKKREENELKCKFVAIVMDRFFFYLALAYAIITFIALIMSIPNFYR